MKRTRLLLVCLLVCFLSLAHGTALMSQEDLVAEMNGAYSTGTEFNLWVATRSGSVRVDYGSGKLVELTVSTDPSLPTKINSSATAGKPIKVYGSDLIALRCFWNKLTTLTLNAPELEVLYCHTNTISTLDLTGSPRLRILDATDAGLTSLQMDGLTLLDTLVCDGNALATLDLKEMNHLKLLECYNNNLSQLDLRACSELIKVSAHKNQLTTLNLSGLTKLESVSCWRNQIAELDLSLASALSSLDCSENHLTKLLLNSSAPISKVELYDNRLSESAFANFVESLPNRTGLDSGVLKAVKTSMTPPEGNQIGLQAHLGARAKNWGIYKGYEELPAPTPQVSLTTSGVKEWTIGVRLVDESQEKNLWVDWNNDGVCQESELGIPPAKHLVDANTITIYGDLEALFCYENNLTELDVSTQSSLKQLSACDNNLTKLDLSQNMLIEDLWLQNNQLTSLSLLAQPALNSINVSGNKISELNFAPESPVIRIEIADNGMKSVDLTNTPNLILLNASGNQFSSFDGTPVPGLSFLNLSNNQIETVDISGLSELIDLNLNGNKLSSINLDGMEWMTKLLLAGNNISTIDLSGAPDLSQLNLAKNPLTALDLTPCSDMIWLNLSSCRLRTVDLSSLSSLSQLYIAYNELTELTLSEECSNLVALDIEGNKIRGPQMQALVEQLPRRESGQGEFYVVAQDSLYGNAISVEQVNMLKDKSWQVFERTESEPTFLPFLGYTMFSVQLNVGEYGTADIVNYQPYNQVPMGIKLHLKVTPDQGYIVQSIMVNGEPLESREFEVLKDTEVQILFQKENALVGPALTLAKIYPNPATDYLYIEDLVPYTDVALYTSSGIQVLSTTAEDSGALQLTVAQLPNGVYYLKVGREIEKVFIAH